MCEQCCVIQLTAILHTTIVVRRQTVPTNNLKNGYKSIHTFDFSTLYTSIPHDQLKNNLFRFINRVFDFKAKPFITPNIFTKRLILAWDVALIKVVLVKMDL